VLRSFERLDSDQLQSQREGADNQDTSGWSFEGGTAAYFVAAGSNSAKVVTPQPLKATMEPIEQSCFAIVPLAKKHGKDGARRRNPFVPDQQIVPQLHCVRPTTNPGVNNEERS